VVGAHDETPRVRSLSFDVPGWTGHAPGQHLDLRLTAPDGYQAQRSYSIATPASGSRLELAVERLDDGEVSPYLHDVLVVGDRVEVRGPIGGHFVWDPADARPVLLVGGGSGVVPLVAMLRARVAGSGTAPMRLLLSSRSSAEIVYRGELARLAGHDGVEVVHTLTREAEAGWTGRQGRVDAALLAEVAWPPTSGAHTFVCGPTSFVELVARALVGLGHAPEGIRTERFGATGA
jgi:ferredoxin-NADP reductase